MSRPALLFDLDGTLMDSDPIHEAVFRELFEARGQSLAPGAYAERIHGRLNRDIFADAFPGEDAEAMADEKEARFRERLGASAAPLPGATALLDRARNRGWGCAAVTNAPRANAEAMLDALGLAERFDALVIGAECARGKPHPDPYLAGIAAVDADPARALAFEDSTSGVGSAASAGLTVLGLRTTLGDDALREAGAAASLADYTDPALAPYLGRLEGPAP